MPGRVANFLRTSSGNKVHNRKVKPRSTTPTSAHASSSSDTSDHEDAPHSKPLHILPDLADAVLGRRLSLPFGTGKREVGHSSILTLDWDIESPPIVLHGTPSESTGALLTGRLIVEVKEEEIEIPCLQAVIEKTFIHKHPVKDHCEDCSRHITQLTSIAMIDRPTPLRKGRHTFPFSVLLEGDLAATMNTSAFSIDYEFRAEATIVRSSAPAPFVTKFTKPIIIKRSLVVPDQTHNSVRVFPPTNIKAGVQYLPVIHPTSSNRVTLSLDGLKTLNEKTKMLDLWKLKKVTWRLEETVRTLAPACDKHAPLLTGEDEPRRGIIRSEKRILGEKMIHEGWKSDFSGKDAHADMEFDYGVQFRSGKRYLKYASDHKSDDGTEVKHSLLIELVVSKEFAPEHKPHLTSQTGQGRILRMHFDVVITDHSGLGVSWDNESPPVYQDVPPSPPAYPVEEAPIEYEDLMLELLEARRASLGRRDSSE